MQTLFKFRWLLLAGMSLTGNLWALACSARTPEAAAQKWLRQMDSVQTFQESKPMQPENYTVGYAVQRTFSDPVLKTQWALVADCAHPARPLIAIALPQGTLPGGRNFQPVQAAWHPVEIPDYAPAHVRLMLTQVVAAGSGVLFQPANATIAGSTPEPVLVRAGDRVVLWNQEPQLRMEIGATALEFGHAGQVIHLRRGGTSSSWNATMTGVVRGPIPWS